MKNKAPRTILVVEDDFEVRGFIVDEILSHVKGFNVCQAANGSEAIKFVEEPNQCQLIITDYEMPICDGAKFIEILRGKNIETSVIIFTGHAAVPISLMAPVIKIVENKNFRALLQAVNDWIKEVA
jgi:DNA-binding NtrC family response regulator